MQVLQAKKRQKDLIFIQFFYFFYLNDGSGMWLLFNLIWTRIIYSLHNPSVGINKACDTAIKVRLKFKQENCCNTLSL